jgi:glycosyltransferase involved in cell wall biosynthesis
MRWAYRRAMPPDQDPPPYTVVIPAYNAAAWIAGAIRSAAVQRPAPVEILVVDDGSEDGTAAIAAAQPGVRVVRRANGGEAAARNTGLREARTRWVSFLDADDTFLPYRHEWLAAHLAAHPDHAVVAADALVEIDGAVQTTHYGQPGMVFPVTDQRRALIDGNPILSHVLCDRERLLALGGFDESLTHACDWDLWLRYVLDGGTIGLVDAPLSRYRRHSASMTGDPVRVTRGDIAVWEKARTLPRLTDDERARIDAHLVEARGRLERDEMKRSLELRQDDVRRRAWLVVRSSRQRAAARLKAAAVFAAPGLVRRSGELRRAARHGLRRAAPRQIR